MQPPCHSSQHARSVQASLWSDSEFARLSHKSRLLYVYLLTHPQLTSLGALRGRLVWFAQELGFRAGEARKAAEELRKARLVEEHEIDCFVAICDYLRHSPPDSPEIVERWYADYRTLPDGPGRVFVLERARVAARGLGATFTREFARVFGVACDDPEGYDRPDRGLSPEECRKHWTQNWCLTLWDAERKRDHRTEPAARRAEIRARLDAALNVPPGDPPAADAEAGRFGHAAGAAETAVIPSSTTRAETSRRSASARSGPGHPAPDRAGESQQPGPLARPAPVADDEEQVADHADDSGRPPRGNDGRFLRRQTAMPSAVRRTRTPRPPGQRRPSAALVQCIVSAIANPLPAGIRSGGSVLRFLQEIQKLRPGPQRGKGPWRYVSVKLKVTPYNPDS